MAALGLWACGDDQPPPDPDHRDWGARPPPQAQCLDPGAGPYTLRFVDGTSAWTPAGGLPLTGSAAATVDIDGDHWPDLALAMAQSVREADPPIGRYRLLRNAAGAGFEDVTWSAGLFTARDGTPGRATTWLVFGDLDNDGDQDAFSAVYIDVNTLYVGDHSEIYLNAGDGSFTLAPEGAFTGSTYDPVSSVATLDWDRDGWLDLFVAHYYDQYGYLEQASPDLLLAGHGDGTFQDVTAAAGAATLPFTLESAVAGTNHRPSWGATACDLDRDGREELLVCTYGRGLNRLLYDSGDGYTDLAQAAGFAADGNTDYGDDLFYRCYCEAHPTEPTCAGASSTPYDCSDLGGWTPGIDDQPWRLGGNSSNALCGDLDKDGDVDLLAVELAHWHVGQASDKTELLRNEGFPQVPFARPGNEASGLTREHQPGWNEGDLGGALVDLDNDGRLDVLVASSDYPDTTSLIWQQVADGLFEEVTADSGARFDRVHGLSLADLDRDGDYDLVLGTSLARWYASDDPPRPANAWARVLLNQHGQDANKLLLWLTGDPARGSNRDALGALVTARVGGRTLVAERQGAHGLQGHQHDALMILGLGAACQVDELSIQWPDAQRSTDTYRDVGANWVLLITPGQDLRYQSLAEYALP